MRQRGPRLGAAVLLAAILLLIAPAPADATWSIVATDGETGELGVAIASCLPADVLGDPSQPLVPVVVVPGVVAGVTQGQLDLAAPDLIRRLAATGATPEEIVGELTVGERGPDQRQHAVADTEGQVAAFTGPEAGSGGLDRQGPGVSVQGNLVASPAVIDDTLAAFIAGRDDGRPLVDNLVEGLLAGSRAGGDRRCGDQHALFAHLVVAGPGDPADAPSTVITVQVSEGDDLDPVEVLAAAFEADEWGAGSRTVIDRRMPGGGAATARWIVLGLGIGAMVVAVLVLRRGLGTVEARR